MRYIFKFCSHTRLMPKKKATCAKKRMQLGSPTLKGGPQFMMFLSDEQTKWIPSIKGGGPHPHHAHHPWQTPSHNASRPPPAPRVGRLGLVSHHASQGAASCPGSWVGRPPSSMRGCLRRLWGRPPSMHCTMRMSESPNTVACMQTYKECNKHKKSNLKANTKCTITCASVTLHHLSYLHI